MLQRSLNTVGSLLGNMLYTLVWMPLVALPRRVWRQALGPAPRLQQWTRTLVPYVVVLATVALVRYLHAIQSRPSLLPAFLGTQRAHLSVWLGETTGAIAIHTQWAVNYTGALLMALNDIAPLIAALVAGICAWIAVAGAATLFSGPLHLMLFDSRSRRILQMPLAPVKDWLQSTNMRMARNWAQRKNQWLVGFTGPLTAWPVLAPLDVSVWVLGGNDRRGNATPLVTLLRAHALANNPIVLIDTLASVAVSEDLQRCAAAAGRAGDFRSVSGPVPQGYFAQAHTRGWIVYVGLAQAIDPSQKDPAQVEAAHQLLSHMNEVASALPAGAPWVVAISDAAELPGLSTSSLLSHDTVIPLLTLNRLDHETATWAYEFKKGAWVVLPVRTAAESNLLVSLCKNDKAGKLKPGTALLVQDGAARFVDRIDKLRN